MDETDEMDHQPQPQEQPQAPERGVAAQSSTDSRVRRQRDAESEFSSSGEQHLARTRSERPAAAMKQPDQDHEIVSSHEKEAPTASHELAHEARKLKPESERGYAEYHDDEYRSDIEVRNLGWNVDGSDKVPNPLVGGLTNEELWVLVRRFDKQIFQVKSIPDPPLDGLDLNIADDEQFSPDKLRAHVERFYMTVLVGLFSLWKHIARLRSWREWKRTTAFLLVFAASWFLNLLAPTCFAFVMVLILSPRSRLVCFPPAPPALVDPSTGGVKKPAAGVFGSNDSVTGAPEKRRGEALELEAHSFVSSISALAVSIAAGKHPQGDPREDLAVVPDPADFAEGIVQSKERATGKETSDAHDRTRKPVFHSVWSETRPVMHAIADVVDTYERLGNALSPTTPFPRHRPRLVLAGSVLPLLLGSTLVTSEFVNRFFGLLVGFVFFGDPVIQRGLAFINRTIPHWQRYLELRNNILRGVPTNAQLTVTLLRVGETNKAPIPPPPSPNSDEPPSTEARVTAGEGLEHLGVDEEEVHDAVQPDENYLAPPEDDDNRNEPDKQIKKKGRKILDFFKGATRSGINTTLAADKMKAKAGSRHAKDRLGVVKKRSQPDPAKGPIRFPARYKGQKGHAYITATATTPALSWTTEIEDLNPAWTMTIADMQELQKVGGLGWKSKIVVGWATHREIADGLIIRDKLGAEHHLTAIFTRDALFNRLVAMGSQMWEAY